MAVFHPMVSMELDDEEKIDAVAPIPMPSKPDFPHGLRICLTERELEKLDIDHTEAFVGGVFHGFFMARITSVSVNGVEAQIEDLAIESEDEENEEAENEA
jgi:hypothetical protein